MYFFGRWVYGGRSDRYNLYNQNEDEKKLKRPPSMWHNWVDQNRAMDEIGGRYGFSLWCSTSDKSQPAKAILLFTIFPQSLHELQVTKKETDAIESYIIVFST